MDKTAPEAMEMDNMSGNLLNRRSDLLAEFHNLLDGQHPRDDYRELLELSIIVLGGERNEEYSLLALALYIVHDGWLKLSMT